MPEQKGTEQEKSGESKDERRRKAGWGRAERGGGETRRG